MYYISTRGEAPRRNFLEVLRAGLAADGGLYLPEHYPSFSASDLQTLSGKSFQYVAFEVLKRFAGEAFPQDVLRAACEIAYQHFHHPSVCPLVELAPNQFLLELFHGPTLAFKDVAMQLLAQLVAYDLAQSQQRLTIIGATSGDTGSAAIEAFKAIKGVEVFILYPDHRVSEVQRRQMTTSAAPNIHTLAVDGNFDDAQRIVKDLFADQNFAASVHLTAVNSINWARIVAQVTYYITSALALGAPQRAVQFAVPTGNFGDIFAGYVAMKMGLPIDQLIIGTNENDILHRALQSGRYEVEALQATSSPSMDIQVSSNFERLLYEVSGRKADQVRLMMQNLKQSQAFTIAPELLQAIRKNFSSAAVHQQEVVDKIASLYQSSGKIVDPHTAIGLVAAERCARSHTPVVTLATAHAAKFPDVVEGAVGVRPGLPAHLADLYQREENYICLPADPAIVKKIILEQVKR